MLWLGKQGTRCDSGTAPPLYVNVLGRRPLSPLLGPSLIATKEREGRRRPKFASQKTYQYRT